MIAQTRHPHELTDFVMNHQSFAIFGHEYVDGDARGSMVGLGQLLRGLGKSCTLFVTHEVPAYLAILDHDCELTLTIDETKHYDAVIFVDFSPMTRITTFIPHTAWILSHPLAIIDHHHDSNPLDVTVYHKDTNACSTCILLAERIYEYFADRMTPSIAQALMMGLMTDTGNFMFPGNYHDIFAIATKLMQSGANKEYLTQRLFRSRSRASVQCSQLVIQRTVMYEGFAWSWMYRDEWEKYDIDKGESKAGMNLLASVEGVGCVVYFDITPNERKLHMRSKKLENGKHISCAKITALFGGGGHHCAAGATIMVNQCYHVGELSFVPQDIGPKGLADIIYQARYDYCVNDEAL